jgi:hypothetical protein
MAKQNPILRAWSALGHITRALWVYHFLGAFAVSAATVYEGFKTIPIAYLIPLTVVAFGGTLYVFNQFIISFNRFREGYTYGLAYEGVSLGYNPDNQAAALQLGILIRNATDRPLRYLVERFDVVVGNTTIANPMFDTFGGNIPRGAQRRCSYPAFNREQIEAFIGKETKGSITVEIHYGHPDGPPARRLKMKISVNLRLAPGATGAVDSILSESDDSF